MKRNIIRILAAGLVLVAITGTAIPIVSALPHDGGTDGCWLEVNCTSGVCVPMSSECGGDGGGDGGTLL